MAKNLCLIPAKGCSTRLPNKNLLKICGKPIVVNAIKKAIAASLFDEICVSTEDEDIAKISKDAGASVPFIRPRYLSKDPSTIVDVINHCIDYYENNCIHFESITVILATTPLILSSDIASAYKIYKKQPDKAVMSVTELESPAYNAWTINGSNLELCFPESKFRFVKSTECPKTYRANGGVLISNTQCFIMSKTYRNLKIIPYVMPQNRSIDIDSEYDYMIAKLLSENMQLNHEETNYV